MQPLWEPTAEQVVRASITRFMQERDVRAPDYPTLHGWSIDKREQFWAAVWRFCGIIAEERTGRQPWDAVLVGRDRMAPPDAELGPRWFSGARLNFAENLLRRDDNEPALIFWNELGRQ